MIETNAFSFFRGQGECQLDEEHSRLTLDQINDRFVERQREVSVSRPWVHQQKEWTLVDLADLEKEDESSR